PDSPPPPYTHLSLHTPPAPTPPLSPSPYPHPSAARAPAVLPGDAAATACGLAGGGNPSSGPHRAPQPPLGARPGGHGSDGQPRQRRHAAAAGWRAPRPVVRSGGAVSSRAAGGR